MWRSISKRLCSLQEMVQRANDCAGDGIKCLCLKTMIVLLWYDNLPVYLYNTFLFKKISVVMVRQKLAICFGEQV